VCCIRLIPHPHYRSCWGICDRNGKTCVTGPKAKIPKFYFLVPPNRRNRCAWHRSSHVSGFREVPHPGPTQFPEESPLSAVKRSATGISWLTLQYFGTQTGSGHGKAGLRGELGIMRRVTLVIGPSKVSIRRSGVGGWHALRRVLLSAGQLTATVKKISSNATIR
jgi:hypothetical protein